MPYYYIKINDAPQWITVHPNGPGTTGTHVQIEGSTGEVLAGMGGKFNGKHISAVAKGGKEEQVGADAVIRHQKAKAAEAKATSSKPASKPASTGVSKPAGKPEKPADNQEAKKSNASIDAGRKKWNNLITTTKRNALESTPEFKEIFRRVVDKKNTDPAYKQDHKDALQLIKGNEKDFVAGAGKLLGIEEWAPASRSGYRLGEAPEPGALLRILGDVYQDKKPSEIVKMASSAASGGVAEFDGRKEVEDKTLSIVKERRKLEASGIDARWAATKVPLPEGFAPVLNFMRNVDYDSKQFVSPPDTGLKISKETEKAVLVGSQWAPKSGVVIDNGFVVGAKPWVARDRNWVYKEKEYAPVVEAKSAVKSLSSDQLKSILEQGNLWEKGGKKRTYISAGSIQKAINLKKEYNYSRKNVYDYRDKKGGLIRENSVYSIDHMLNGAYYDHADGNIHLKNDTTLDEYLKSWNLI